VLAYSSTIFDVPLMLGGLFAVGEFASLHALRVGFFRHAFADLNRLALAPGPRAFGYALDVSGDVAFRAWREAKPG
jgi:hypothetical protein